MVSGISPVVKFSNADYKYARWVSFPTASVLYTFFHAESSVAMEASK